jgi:hypothetical protein
MKTAKENMSLTDDECDQLLRWDGGIRLDSFAIEEVSGFMFRKGLREPCDITVRLETTCGYISTLDSLINMSALADMMDHRSHIEDIRVVLEVDGDKLPECALADCVKAINRYAIRKGFYRLPPEVPTTVEPV